MLEAHLGDSNIVSNSGYREHYVVAPTRIWKESWSCSKSGRCNSGAERNELVMGKGPQMQEVFVFVSLKFWKDSTTGAEGSHVRSSLI